MLQALSMHASKATTYYLNGKSFADGRNFDDKMQYAYANQIQC